MIDSRCRNEQLKYRYVPVSERVLLVVRRSTGLRIPRRLTSLSSKSQQPNERGAITEKNQTIISHRIVASFQTSFSTESQSLSSQTSLSP